jgi:hypothetical protein
VRHRLGQLNRTAIGAVFEHQAMYGLGRVADWQEKGRDGMPAEVKPRTNA